MRQQAQFINSKGMNQDLSISKFNPEMIYYGLNIRLNTGEDGNLYSITNEKGNIQSNIWTGMPGRYSQYQLTYVIGCTTIKDSEKEYIILFTTSRKHATKEVVVSYTGGNRILRLEKHVTWNGISNFDLYCTELRIDGFNYLNFSADALIETLPLYESDEVMKVYFVDKNNPIRFINVSPLQDGRLDSHRIQDYNLLNFTPELPLDETIKVEKRDNGGQFHSGVIQYAFTYWNLHGQESNIFDYTPLYYLSHKDRAGSPEEICSNSFRIEISNITDNSSNRIGHVQHRFDYVRVYSIHRTSIDAVPTCRIVGDIALSWTVMGPLTIELIDNGIIGSTVTPQLLNFIGGEELYVGTIAHKDNTLFTGNIYSNFPNLKEIQEWLISNPVIPNTPEAEVVSNSRIINFNDINGKIYNYNPYTLEANSSIPDNQYIRHWKYGEKYRIGFIAQWKNGQWSSPIWICDMPIDKSFEVQPIKDINTEITGNKIIFNEIQIDIPAYVIDWLYNNDFKCIKPIYVPLMMSERTVLSQGFLTPTIAQYGNRVSNSPYSYTDYYSRPNREFCNSITDSGMGLGTFVDNNLGIEFTNSPMVTTHLTSITNVGRISSEVVKNPNATARKINRILGWVLTGLTAGMFAANMIVNNWIAKKLFPGDNRMLNNLSIYIPNSSFAIHNVYSTNSTSNHPLLNPDRYYWVNNAGMNLTHMDQKASLPYAYSEILAPILTTRDLSNSYGSNLYPLLFAKGVLNNSFIDEIGSLNDFWFVDKNIVNFWSPEAYYGVLNDLNIQSINKIRFVGMSCLTTCDNYIDMNFERNYELESAKEYQNADDRSGRIVRKYDNYINNNAIYALSDLRFNTSRYINTFSINGRWDPWPIARQILDVYSHNDSDNFWQLWKDDKSLAPYNIPGDNNNRTAKYKYKKHSNSKISWFTKSLLSPFNVNIYKPRYVEKENLAFIPFEGNPDDGDNLIYNHNVNEVLAGTLVSYGWQNDLTNVKGENNDYGTFATNIKYKSNNHLLFTLKNDLSSNQSSSDSIIPEFNTTNINNELTPLMREGNNKTYTNYKDSVSLLGMSFNDLFKEYNFSLNNTIIADQVDIPFMPPDSIILWDNNWLTNNATTIWADPWINYMSTDPATYVLDEWFNWQRLESTEWNEGTGGINIDPLAKTKGLGRVTRVNGVDIGQITMIAGKYTQYYDLNSDGLWVWYTGTAKPFYSFNNVWYEDGKYWEIINNAGHDEISYNGVGNNKKQFAAVLNRVDNWTGVNMRGPTRHRAIKDENNGRWLSIDKTGWWSVAVNSPDAAGGFEDEKTLGDFVFGDYDANLNATRVYKLINYQTNGTPNVPPVEVVWGWLYHEEPASSDNWYKYDDGSPNGVMKQFNPSGGIVCEVISTYIASHITPRFYIVVVNQDPEIKDIPFKKYHEIVVGWIDSDSNVYDVTKRKIIDFPGGALCEQLNSMQMSSCNGWWYWQFRITALQNANNENVTPKNVDYSSGLPYFWLVDLIKDNDKQYLDPNIENLSHYKWIPCGDKMKINGRAMSQRLKYTHGDTFIQRFDCFRISPLSNTFIPEQTTTTINPDWQQHSDFVSTWIESFINLDGRWDKNRRNTKILDLSFENVGLNNQVYSQNDNFFERPYLDFNKLLLKGDMPTTFAWSQPKFYNEPIDTWTNLWLNNSYTVLGDLGMLNKLENYSNELFGFQDTGIFQILYNSRVQVPVSDGTPIEITQGYKVPEVKYISKKIGSINKWGIKQTARNLYFIDNINQDVNVLSNNIDNVTDKFGFRVWAKDNLHLNKVSDVLYNKDQFILNSDLTNDDLYISNWAESLKFSERLMQFESFYSYEDTAFHFNAYNEYFMFKNNPLREAETTLWTTNRGRYNYYFGLNKQSEIDYFVNPNPNVDKVFDVVEYRADLFDEDPVGLHQHNVYMPKETFDYLDVYNEYQNGLMPVNPNRKYINSTSPTSDWRRKKFRIWDVELPREWGTLNRIRNPWIRIKLTLNNQNCYKLLLHDLIVNYTTF